MMLAAKLAVARAAGTASRLTGRGGTSLPGRVLVRLEPQAIEELARRLPDGCAVVSATNGKTTTAALVSSILGRRGVRLVHNRAGANMAGGVASALLRAVRGAGMDGDLGLFEVDEFWLDRVVGDLCPRVLALANLFRDQLDRFGELEAIADRWAAVLESPAGRAACVALNSDDPLVADLGRQHPNTLYFGVQDERVALPGLEHASDSKHCRRCGHPYSYEAVYLGHLGRYHCPNCGAERPVPAVAAEEVALDGLRGTRFVLRTPAGRRPVRLPLPGLYNVYNALAAAALALALGTDDDDIVAGLEAVRPAFGRAETVSVNGRRMAILLVKNPAGTNEVLRTLALEPGELDLLGVLNDRTADGHDVSWVWDADFETVAGRVRRATCSGTRAAELALRLKYAGVPAERLVVVPNLQRALEDALDHLPAADATLYAVPTYTAMLALRDLLSARGHVPSSWA